VAVLAAGSVEQHGAHLPLGTDAYAALTVAERVAERLDTVVAPLGPAGVAHYHLPWGGTLTLEPSTLIAVVVDVCSSLREAGVRRIVIVNWHEGNSPTLCLAAEQAQRRLGLRVLIAETHVIANSLFPDEMEFTTPGRWRPRRCSPTTPGSCASRSGSPAATPTPAARRTSCSAAATSTRCCATSTRSPPTAAGTAIRSGRSTAAPRWTPPCCATSAVWRSSACRCPSPAPTRRSAACGPAGSAAPTSSWCTAASVASGRPRCRSSSATSGPASWPRSVPGPSARAWPSATGSSPRTTPAAGPARCAARAATTCASASASPASASTGTLPPARSPSTWSGPPGCCTSCRTASATWRRRWSTRAR
jgi:hypothetical protein